jgi:uncharacterized phage protein gp47/JayE
MIQLTNNGVQVQTYEEIYNELSDGYRVIYGNDINLDPDTPDGQRVGIEARTILDMQLYLQSVFNQLDPALAQGVALEKLIKTSGLTRQPASKSQADIEIVTSRAITIPVGYKVQDEIGQVFETASETSLPIGTNTITVFAENFGAIEAPAGTINKPATIILGVTSITNPADATVGKDEETDEKLRTRRGRSLENPATSTIGGLFSALGNLPNVSDLAIYENDSDIFDPILSLEAHSIWIVIEGGDLTQIVEAIVRNKTAGAGLKGETIGEYTETVTVGDLTFNNTSIIEFDRPLITNAFVNINIEAKNGVTINQEVIKSALSDENYRVGEELVASKLYSIVYNAQSSIIATDLEISTNGVDFVDTLIDASPREKFQLVPENININIVQG